MVASRVGLISAVAFCRRVSGVELISRLRSYRCICLPYSYLHINILERMLNLLPLHYVICLLRILRENSSVTFLLREKYFVRVFFMSVYRIQVLRFLMKLIYEQSKSC